MSRVVIKDSGKTIYVTGAEVDAARLKIRLAQRDGTPVDEATRLLAHARGATPIIPHEDRHRPVKTAQLKIRSNGPNKLIGTGTRFIGDAEISYPTIRSRRTKFFYLGAIDLLVIAYGVLLGLSIHGLSVHGLSVHNKVTVWTAIAFTFLSASWGILALLYWAERTVRKTLEELLVVPAARVGDDLLKDIDLTGVTVEASRRDVDSTRGKPL